MFDPQTGDMRQIR